MLKTHFMATDSNVKKHIMVKDYHKIIVTSTIYCDNKHQKQHDVSVMNLNSSNNSKSSKSRLEQCDSIRDIAPIPPKTFVYLSIYFATDYRFY